ncbi:hypothetical protein FRC08_002655 [Ceratobasidium sp. 394]|nr:hypothetical protein FRC08_002655 [Ceratobasidium sp. 394]
MQAASVSQVSAPLSTAYLTAHCSLTRPRSPWLAQSRPAVALDISRSHRASLACALGSALMGGRALVLELALSAPARSRPGPSAGLHPYARSHPPRLSETVAQQAPPLLARAHSRQHSPTQSRSRRSCPATRPPMPPAHLRCVPAHTHLGFPARHLLPPRHVTLSRTPILGSQLLPPRSLDRAA